MPEKRDGKTETGGEGIQYVSEHDEDNGACERRSGLRNDSSEEGTMIKFILGFMLGMLLGMLLGFLLMGMCVAAADRMSEEYFQKMMEEQNGKVNRR